MNLPPLVAAYREAHPGSRAIRPYTLARSSGRVRRAECIFCRAVIATCSAEWPATKRFQSEIEAHECDAMARYRVTYRIVPTSDLANVWAAGADCNSFATKREAELALAELAETTGTDPGSWAVRSD